MKIITPKDTRSKERQIRREDTVNDLVRCKITEGVEVSMWSPENSAFPRLNTFRVGQRTHV